MQIVAGREFAFTIQIPQQWLHRMLAVSIIISLLHLDQGEDRTRDFGSGDSEGHWHNVLLTSRVLVAR